MTRKFIVSIAAAGIVFWAFPLFAAASAGGLIPAPTTLPEPKIFLKILLLLTFYIHILLVSILLGSTLLAFFKWNQTVSGGTGSVSFLPKILALAVNFGIPPYLFTQVLYGNTLYPSIILMAVWWMSVAGFAMIAYYGLYVVNDNAGFGPARKRLVLALVAVLLMLVAFLLSTASTFMIRPDRWTAWFDNPNGVLLNLGDPTSLPRYLHIITGSLAVGGLTLACRALWSRRDPETDARNADARIRTGLAWFMYPSMLQVPIGLTFLLLLPANARNLFLGGSAIAVAALMLALAGLVLALVFAKQGKVKPTCAVALGIILIMVCIRDIVREAMLHSYAADVITETGVDALPISGGQGSAFVVFLICYGLAVAVIAYMARITLKTFGRGKTPAPQEG